VPSTAAAASETPRYSFVIPLFDEELVLPILFHRLGELMDRLDGSAEVILVDDGSRDRSGILAAGKAKDDPRFRYVALSRNFGHQIAITAGMDLTRGDAVIVMDADLQDPPEVVLDLVAKWREGYEIVYAQRVSRAGESRLKLVTADLFYRLAVVSLSVPPLSSRREDIPLLFARLLAEAAARHRVEARAPTPAMLAAILARDWPGNVRELRNAADRCALGLGIEARDDTAAAAPGRLADRVAAYERAEILRALIAHGGALKPVYETLGLSRKTLYEKMVKLGIDKGQITGD
jgi:hypothetical protein